MKQRWVEDKREGTEGADTLCHNGAGCVASHSSGDKVCTNTGDVRSGHLDLSLSCKNAGQELINELQLNCLGPNLAGQQEGRLLPKPS